MQDQEKQVELMHHHQQWSQNTKKDSKSNFLSPC